VGLFSLCRASSADDILELARNARYSLSGLASARKAILAKWLMMRRSSISLISMVSRRRRANVMAGALEGGGRRLLRSGHVPIPGEMGRLRYGAPCGDSGDRIRRLSRHMSPPNETATLVLK